MKFYTLALLAFLLTAISTSVNAQDNVTKASLDTAFAKGSTVTVTSVNPQQVQTLALLGQVWGFIKYHHPAVAKGDHNMDAELFRVMPAVVAAKNTKEASAAMEKWVDGFGVPDKCTSCKPYDGKDIVIKPNYGIIFDKNVVGASLAGKLKYVLDNRNQGANHYVNLRGKWHQLVIQNELPYAGMTYPDAGYRLLSVYRYWNIIQYYYPYKDVIGRDWNTVLPELISDFVAAKDAFEYQRAVTKMAVNVNDSHASLASQHRETEMHKGIYLPPFQAKFIEDKFVVTAFYNDVPELKEKLKIGDVITAINGVPTADAIKKLLPITSGSNHATKLRNMANLDLLRGTGEQIALGIARGDSTANVTLSCLPIGKVNFMSVLDPEPKAVSYKMLDDHIGYLNVAKYRNADLPEIQRTLNDNKGIIVDLRGYPRDVMHSTFVTAVKTGSKTEFAKFSSGSIAEPGLFTVSEALGTDAANIYKGKVVVMVNEGSQSAAEFIAMAFQSSDNVTVIGSITAGADGDIARFVLPGAMHTAISGLGVFYPDGTPTQRVGIKIDEVVKPTIAGIKAGKDELLERAKEIILK